MKRINNYLNFLNKTNGQTRTKKVNGIKHFKTKGGVKHFKTEGVYGKLHCQVPTCHCQISHLIISLTLILILIS